MKSVIFLTLVLFALEVKAQVVKNHSFEQWNFALNHPTGWMADGIRPSTSAISGNYSAALNQFGQGLEPEAGFVQQWIQPIPGDSVMDSIGAVYMFVDIPRVIDTSTALYARVESYGFFPRESVLLKCPFRLTNGFQSWWIPYHFSKKPDSLLISIGNLNTCCLNGAGLTDTIWVDSIYVGQYQSALSLEEKLVEHRSVQTYPNPATDFLNIQLLSRTSIEQWEIVDNRGVSVLRGTNLVGIDVSHLPAGSYIWKGQNQGEVLLSPFIIHR